MAREVNLFYFPKGINIKMKSPKSNKFTDYVTKKAVIFCDKQIVEKYSNEENLCVNVRYHLGIIPRKYIKRWSIECQEV